MSIDIQITVFSVFGTFKWITVKGTHKAFYSPMSCAPINKAIIRSRVRALEINRRKIELKVATQHERRPAISSNSWMTGKSDR
jgi:hypothetical protein